MFCACIYEFVIHGCFLVQSHGTSAMTGQQTTYKKSVKEDRPLRFKREHVKGTQASSSPKVMPRKLLVVDPVGVVNLFNEVRPFLPIKLFNNIIKGFH